MSAVLDYKRKIYAIRDLPTLPIIAQKVLSLADDEESGLEKLSSIISSDQSLAVKVLSLANSAYYGHRAKISTINHAVVVIGTNMLKQLSLSVVVHGAFARTGRAQTTFWKHSFGTATAASMIAAEARIAAGDVCFMGGLLHDVGELIIHTHFPEEKDLNHTEVGAWMAERWQLPQQLVDAIAHHHSTEVNHLLNPVVACVHASNVCARLALENNEREPIEIHPNVLAALGLAPAQFTKIVMELKNKGAQIDQLLR
jgi:putative nucleotidyltransferase with HDIG domain